MKVLESLRLILAIPLLTLAAVSPSTLAATGTQTYVSFRKQTIAAAFSGSNLTGTVIGSRDGRADVHLASSGLGTGDNRALYGNKAPYRWGRLVSPEFTPARPFDRAVPSWNARTPAGTWIQVELRAYRPGDNAWTRYYNMGVWASGAQTVERHSVDGQADKHGNVETDTLMLSGGAVYTRYQYRLTLFTTDLNVSPSVSLMSVVTSDAAKEPAGLNIASDREAWGSDLSVPGRSQRVYPEGADKWCSPTSVSMALAHWGHDIPVPEVAAGIHDATWEGTGNWPFNTAYAATKGLDAYVTRMSSMAQLEEWISAGVPVIVSYAFNEGELDGAPQRSSDGHIILVRGFDKSGNVIVNDPAFPADSQVWAVYKRAQLEKVWLRESGGTVYLMYPKGHAIPTSKRYGSW